MPLCRFLSGHPRARVPGRELQVPGPGRREQLLLVAGVRPLGESPVVGGELPGRALRHPRDGRGHRKGRPGLGRAVNRLLDYWSLRFPRIFVKDRAEFPPFPGS